MAKTKAGKATDEKANANLSLNAPPTMKPEIVVFKISGVSPLLQNNPAEFIGKGQGEGITRGKKEYDDEEEARLRTYRDEDGRYCHPTEAFLKSMVKAVAGKKIGKMFATSALKGSVFIVEEKSVILDASGKPATAYTIDRRSVVIGKARVLRCRPCWKEWRMLIALEVDTAICSPENVRDALSLAGRTVGVGDYRPEKGGGFGRYVAKIMK